MKTGKEKLVTIYQAATNRGCKTITVRQMADYSGLSEKSVYMHISWYKWGYTTQGRLFLNRLYRRAA